MAKFEFIAEYKDAGLPLPVRKTAESAGYDFVVAKDTVIPPYSDLVNNMLLYSGTSNVLTLNEVAEITKSSGAKPTLIPTGVKCQLDPGTYLELSVRSSCPLKYWLILANGVGVIDRDYYQPAPTESGEGHIQFQVINLSPYSILLKKGEAIGQGVIKPYLTTEDDQACGIRNGAGFGSTDK